MQIKYIRHHSDDGRGNTMTIKVAIEGISAAWSTRLATMPDRTAEQRNERRLVAQFIKDLGRILEVEQ